MMTPISRCLQRIQRLDLRMLLWFFGSQRFDVWSALARSCSRTGDGWMQIALPTLILVLDRAHGMAFFLSTALAFAFERPLYWVLKNTLQRPRPPEAIPSFHSVVIASDRFSFPSGHTAAAFLLAGNTVLHYGAIGSPLYLWASAVGLSRVALGVHFPTDILAGMVLGTSIACLVSNTDLLPFLMMF